MNKIIPLILTDNKPRNYIKGLAGFLLLILFTACIPVEIFADSLTNKSKFGQARIINGDTVEVGKYPWMAGILKGSNKNNPSDAIVCGASLIHKQWVLTAAHCMTEFRTAKHSEGLNSIWINHPDLNSEQGLIVDIEQTYIHPYWLSQEFDGDIALLKLSQAVDIQPLPITGKSYGQYNYPTDTPSIVMGWGGTEIDGGNPSSHLLEVEVPIVAQSICDETMPSFGPFDEKMLCAGLHTGGKDSCYGDSGGPLIVKNGDKLEQIGLVSAGGDLCAQANEYGTYTRIESYADWISDTICDKDNLKTPVLEIMIYKEKVSIDIVSSEYSSHRLYYAPYPDMQPISYIDLFDTKSYSTELPNNSHYFIAVRGYDGPCNGPFSAIKTIKMD